MKWRARFLNGFVFVGTAAILYSIIFGFQWIESTFGRSIMYACLALYFIALGVIAVRLDMRRYQLTPRQMLRFYAREARLPFVGDKPPKDRQ